ncbi:MAG: hypothetical protein IKL10_07335 [Clostridia bacterium]|nr:hypothetical protein [Clostridia bacterium]
MKKILSIALVLIIVLSLTACSGSNSDETTSDEFGGNENSAPVVSLICDNTEVSAGDTVSVYIHIKDALYTACFDIYVYADEKLVFESEEAEVLNANLIMAANIMDEDTDDYVAVRGIVSTTYDLPDNNIYRLDYKVSGDATSGDKLSVMAQVPTYQVGFDKSGNDVYSVEEEIQINNLVLTVK